MFCGVCFVVSASWFWYEMLSEGQYNETLAPVNNIMLAVISGIIGIVLFGFTGWHLYLAGKGQTTIECLEKTRYLSPLRKSLQHQHIANHQDEEAPSYGQQLVDIHTNALPGVTRPEEGEINVPMGANSHTHLIDRVPGQALPHAVAREREEARQRHEEYLDELDSEKLPNAFDLGWKRNLLQLFGHKPSLWFIPVNTTIGDGWAWEASPKWLEARDTIRREREEQRERERIAGWGEGAGRSVPVPKAYSNGAARHYVSEPVWPYGEIPPQNPNRQISKADRVLGRESRPSKADRILGRVTSQYADGDNVSPTRLPPRDPNIGELDADDYDSSSDEQDAVERETDLKLGIPQSSIRSISPTWTGSGVSGAFGSTGGVSPGMSPVRQQASSPWRHTPEDGVD